MFALIENSLEMDRVELDQQKDWDELVEKAFTVRDKLHEVNAEFKQQLVENIYRLVLEVKDFSEDFELRSPMLADLSPS